MTKQVTEGQPITVVIRSQVGGFIPDAPIQVDGQVYTDPGLSEEHDELKANGAGEFIFYAAPGSIINVSSTDPIAVPNEPIQVVGVTGRPGGLAAVHPADTPEVHDVSPLSEHVTDSSLVGAVGPADALPEEEGGAAAAVGVDKAQNVPPAPVEGVVEAQTPAELMAAQAAAPETPDGTAATDPDSVSPPSTQSEQVTPMFEPQPPGPEDSHVAPESVTMTDSPLGSSLGDGAGTAADVHGADSPAVDPPVDPNADRTQPTGETTAGTSEPA